MPKVPRTRPSAPPSSLSTTSGGFRRRFRASTARTLDAAATLLSLTQGAVATLLSLTLDAAATLLSLTQGAVATLLSLTLDAVATLLSLTQGAVATLLSLTLGAAATLLSLTQGAVAALLSLTQGAVATLLSLTLGAVATLLGLTQGAVATLLSLTLVRQAQSGVISAVAFTSATLVGWIRPEDETEVPENADDREVRGTSAEEIAQIADFLGRIQVTPVVNTRLVDVFFVAADPVFAAHALNTHVEEYVQLTLDRRLQNTQSTAEWLDEELATQQLAVEASEQALASTASNRTPCRSMTTRTSSRRG